MTASPTLDQVCGTAGDILDALAARKAELGLSNAYIEEAATLAAGEVDKMLGPSRIRPLNVFKLGDLLEILALDVVFRHSPAKAARMAAMWEQREIRNVRDMNRISKAALKRARPVVFQAAGAIGGQVRACLLGPKQASDIARKGGRERAKKLKKIRRSEIARMAAKARWAKPRATRGAGTSPAAAPPAPAPRRRPRSAGTGAPTAPARAPYPATPG